MRRIWLTAFLVSSLIFSACQRAETTGGLDEAEALLKLLDYGTAQTKLERIRPSLEAGSAEWARASYALMLARWHSSPATAEQLQGAVLIAQELLDSPQVEADLKSRVRLDLARIYEIRDYFGDEVRVPRARELYREVLDSTETPAIRYEAIIRLANTYRKELTQESSEEAVEILTDFMATAPEVELWTSIAWQTLGDIQSGDLRDYSEALESYEEAMALGFVNLSQLDITYWRMAVWAEETGQTERAIEILSIIAGEMPRSTYQSLALQRIEELGGVPPEPSWLSEGEAG